MVADKADAGDILKDRNEYDEGQNADFIKRQKTYIASRM